MRSGTFTVYKSSGAAQFSLMPVRYSDKGFVEREGAVFLEVAPGNGDKKNPTWDWKQKLTFAIGLNDICQCLDQTKDAVRSIHDNQGVLKTFEIRPGEGDFAGTFMLSLSEGEKTSRKQVRVPLNNGEYQVLMRLLVAAAPLMLNWTPASALASGNDVQGKDN